MLACFTGQHFYLSICGIGYRDTHGYATADFATLLLLVAGTASGRLVQAHPNEAVVLPLFGAYKGTVYDSGLRWANPFDSKCKVSVRVRNFESEKFKVNDLYGNSIEIATVVVWKVVDTAESVFLVDNYEDFVHVQSEAALSMVQMALDKAGGGKGSSTIRGAQGHYGEQSASGVLW
jgi:hypothetical protein